MLEKHVIGLRRKNITYDNHHFFSTIWWLQITQVSNRFFSKFLIKNNNLDCF